MTTVVRAAEAPRAASSISNSSTRCSWTGGTSGWMRYTSRSRQFAASCTWRQSLANRCTRHGDNGVPRWAQISRAKSGCALPLNTAISRTARSYVPGCNAGVRPCVCKANRDRGGGTMGLDDIVWTDAPEPKRYGARWLGWTTFWLVVIGGAVTLGWTLANVLAALEN